MYAMDSDWSFNATEQDIETKVGLELLNVIINLIKLKLQLKITDGLLIT